MVSRYIYRNISRKNLLLSYRNYSIFDLDISQLDAVNTFINITLDKIFYYRILEGFYIPGKYLFLNKTFYNLARAPRFWFKNFSNILLSIGFRQILDIFCFFISRVIIVFFYMDDIIIFNRKEIKQLLKNSKPIYIRSIS
jgi:hypothetical protein